MDAVMVTYRLSGIFPPAERYGLTGQMRRAAVSVPSNVAEGQALTGRASLNYLSIALGSFAELDTQLEVAMKWLVYLARAQAAELQKLIDSGRRLLHGLRRSKRQRLLVTIATKATVVLLLVGAFS